MKGFLTEVKIKLSRAVLRMDTVHIRDSRPYLGWRWGSNLGSTKLF